MSYSDNGAQRPMVQGNWTCSDCGVAITELPFQPRDDSSVQCRDCHKKNRDSRPPRRDDRGPRQTFSGSWTCSGCGAEITELPFEPRFTDNLKCRDCFRK